MRRAFARWLRRLADRLHPQREMRVRLTADSEIFKAAMADAEERLRRSQQTRRHYAGYTGPNVTPSESGVAVTFTDSLPRRQA